MQRHNIRRTLKCGICVIGAVFWSIVAPTLKAQCAPTAAPIGAVRIQSKTIFESLVDLGLAYNVCFGVEVDNDELLRSPIDLELSDATPLTAARSALKTRSGYSVASDGLLSVRPIAEPPTSWLDFKIHRFAIPGRVNVATASNALLMSLQQQVQPRNGYAGHYRVADNTDLVGPFDEREKSVRELLDLIVTSSKGALWITTRPYARTESPPELFWTMLEYSDPTLKSQAAVKNLEQRIAAALAQ